MLHRVDEVFGNAYDGMLGYHRRGSDVPDSRAAQAEGGWASDFEDDPDVGYHGGLRRECASRHEKKRHHSRSGSSSSASTVPPVDQMEYPTRGGVIIAPGSMSGGGGGGAEAALGSWPASSRGRLYHGDRGWTPMQEYALLEVRAERERCDRMLSTMKMLAVGTVVGVGLEVAVLAAIVACSFAAIAAGGKSDKGK